jgi:hypothetical protein
VLPSQLVILSIPFMGYHYFKKIKQEKSKKKFQFPLWGIITLKKLSKKRAKRNFNSLYGVSLL